MTERKLFLTSSGIQWETRPHLLKLIGDSPDRIKVGLVFAPSNKERDVMLNQEAQRSLQDYGFYQIRPIDLGLHDLASLRGTLDKLDMVYMNAGNTFNLLDWVKKSGLDKLLRNRDYAHIIYCGSSAGSLITGPSIELAAWPPYTDKNKAKLEDLRGLNIVNFAVAPHCISPLPDKIATQYRTTNYPVVAITDTQAIVVNSNGCTVVGEGKAEIFTKQSDVELQKAPQQYFRHSNGFHRQVHIFRRQRGSYSLKRR